MRRYTTRPGAPAESVKSTIKKYNLESFSKYTGISNIMKVGWKSVPGGYTGVEEATFTKSCLLLISLGYFLTMYRVAKKSKLLYCDRYLNG